MTPAASSAPVGIRWVSLPTDGSAPAGSPAPVLTLRRP